MSTQRRICLRCERMSRSGGKAAPRQIVVADGNASLPMDRKFAPRFQPVLPVFQADLHAAMATTSFLQGHQRISISTTDFRPRDTHVPYKGRSLFVKYFEADNDLSLNMFRTLQAGSGTVVEKRKEISASTFLHGRRACIGSGACTKDSMSVVSCVSGAYIQRGLVPRWVRVRHAKR